MVQNVSSQPSSARSRHQRWIWSSVIALNVLVLALIGFQLIGAMASSAGTSSETLRWSDPVPPLGAWSDLHGRPVELDTLGAGRHLVLFFFGSKAAGAVQTVSEELAAALPAEAPVRVIGVLAGQREEGEAPLVSRLETSAQLITDPDRKLRRALRLIDDDEAAHTLVIGPDRKVGLIFQGILPSHLLLDYLWREALGREALGREGSAPQPVSRVAAQSPPEGVAPAPLSMPSPAPSEPFEGFSTGAFRTVERVADLSVFRLRRAADGHLLALSRSESRVFILDADLHPTRALGGFGQAPGRFMMPSDLAVDARGKLVVLDAGNRRVQVLHPDGSVEVVVPIDADVVSLAPLGTSELLLSMPGVGSAFSRLDLARARPQARPFGDFWEIPWLRDRVERSFESADRRAAHEGLAAALNRAFVISDPAGGFWAVPIWEPRVRRFDSSGRQIAEAVFSFESLAEKQALFEETLQDALENRHLGILYLFQDLSLGMDGRTLALTVLGTCPGVVLLSTEGELMHELCLQDEEGLPIAPVSVAQDGTGVWWVANANGIYRLDFG